jgi:flavin-dependent dehydrogenase
MPETVIVGGGPAGSLCAIHLSKLGIPTLVVERDSSPRFHIGESLTGEGGNLLREVGLEEAMLSMRYPVKYGVRIYGPSGRSAFWIPVKKRDPDNHLQDTFTWQVRRSTFDRLLIEQAQRLGAEIIQGRAISPKLAADGQIRGVTVQLESGKRIEVESKVLVDASGQYTFLANANVTGPKQRGNFDRQVAIYAHVEGVTGDAGDQWGNTLMFFQKKNYWAWLIPIDEITTSIGFVVPSDYFMSSKESKREFFVRELIKFNKELSRRTKGVGKIETVHASSNYSYYTERFSGKGWLCIGDSHRFIDPLFSFGLNIGMSEGRQAAQAILHFLGGSVDDDRPFLAYEQWSTQGVDACQVVLDGFWNNTLAFGLLMRNYSEDFIDLFAGRVWQKEYRGLSALRDLLRKS